MERQTVASSAPQISPWPARTGVSRTELDPVAFLRRSAAVHPERVAVVHGERRLTYAQLEERVDRLAWALRARGLERHDRVAALCPNAPALLELHHAVLARMEDLNIRVVHVYGLTETYGPHTVCGWQDDRDDLAPAERARLLARQGHAYTTADPVRVVDEDMRDVPRDGTTMGEVVMRGNNVMAGYFANEAATEQAFRGGWFHSGDLAVWHPDGAIELRDRGKDIIISGGENISSIEVEQTICAHPAVLECAVVAVPHDHWGERPKAFVALRPAATATEQEIIAFCRERLAHFKCPDAVAFGPLPKTSTGKVQKFLLREPEWSGRERRIN